MESNKAAEHLQTIRTLMERSALYRRALAPIMTFLGAVGCTSALAGWLLQITSPTSFILYWFAVGIIALVGAFLLARRQAWRESQPFWSPPTRRIAQAMLPPLTAGFVLGALMVVADNLPSDMDPPTGGFPPNWLVMCLLPILWVVFYGCAVHAAGFFMPRGMKLFGFGIVIIAFAALVFGGSLAGTALVNFSYAVMGGFFGILNLAYGTYLALTEKGKNVA